MFAVVIELWMSSIVYKKMRLAEKSDPNAHILQKRVDDYRNDEQKKTQNKIGDSLRAVV